MKQIKDIEYFLIALAVFILFLSFLWYFDALLFIKDKGEWYSKIAFKSYDTNDYNKSLEYANKAIDSGQENIEIRKLRVTIYQKLGLYQEAKNALALDNLNKSQYYYFQMGQTLNYLGDINKSLYYFKEGTIKYPFYVDNYIGLGLGYYQLGDMEKALEYLEKSENLVELSFPEDEIRQKNRLTIINVAMGLVYEKNGSISKAEEKYEVARSLDQGSANFVYDYLGI